jgi:hypothetical protein
MKIPEKVKIGGLNYTVKLLKMDTEAGQDAIIGQHDSGQIEIIIDNTVPKDKQESTFIHEILEAINHIYGLKLKHHTLDALEAGLYQVFKDNDLLKG